MLDWRRRYEEYEGPWPHPRSWEGRQLSLNDYYTLERSMYLEGVLFALGRAHYGIAGSVHKIFGLPISAELNIHLAKLLESMTLIVAHYEVGPLPGLSCRSPINGGYLATFMALPVFGPFGSADWVVDQLKLPFLNRERGSVLWEGYCNLIMGINRIWKPMMRDYDAPDIEILLFASGTPEPPDSFTLDGATRYFTEAAGQLIQAVMESYVAALANNPGEEAALLEQLRHSRFGPLLADWITQNRDALANHPIFRQAGPGGAAAGNLNFSTSATPAAQSGPTPPPYTVDPNAKPPKAGATTFKRLHPHGDPQDPYTLMPDGKPLGATPGAMPTNRDGLKNLPPGHADYVRCGWPDLNTLDSRGKPRKDFRNFKTLHPEILPPGTRLYRIVDENNPDAGAYWATELPANKTAWRRDYAVKDSWNDNGYYVEYYVGPDGLKVWRGEASGQAYRIHGGKEFYLNGGKEQLFITPGATTPTAARLTHWREV